MQMRALAMAAALALALAVEPGAGEPKQNGAGTCRSIGGLKFDSSQRSMQRGKGLEVCSQYKRNTCCNETHAMALRLKIREPVVANFNQRCQKITEEMACSACHPFIGTGKMKSVCPRLCDEWFYACRSEFYSYGAAGSLTPCFGNALVCSQLSAIAANGAEFCSKMGFQVGNEDDSEGHDCFDGSVPRQLGEAEPTEPWQEMLKRRFQEQSENPSGEFIVMLFAPLVALFLVYRLIKKSRAETYTVDSGRRTLTMEQVRALQQLRYGADGYDSDSSSPPPEDEEHGSDDDEPKSPVETEKDEATKKTD